MQPGWLRMGALEESTTSIYSKRICFPNPRRGLEEGMLFPESPRLLGTTADCSSLQFKATTSVFQSVESPRTDFCEGHTKLQVCGSGCSSFLHRLCPCLAQPPLTDFNPLAALASSGTNTQTLQTLHSKVSPSHNSCRVG